MVKIRVPDAEIGLMCLAWPPKDQLKTETRRQRSESKKRA
jgi:hypothetical protein